MTAAKLYLVVLIVFLVMDAVWLGLLMKGFYNTELGDLARRDNGAMSPRWPAAVLVYVIIPLGIVMFVRPAMGSAATWPQAAGWGALFGLIGYGIYDLTNRAVLERWSLKMTVIDMVWGATICGVCALVMRIAEARLAGK